MSEQNLRNALSDAIIIYNTASPEKGIQLLLNTIIKVQDTMDELNGHERNSVQSLLPIVKVQLMNLYAEQNMKEEAKELATEVSKTHPDFPSVKKVLAW